MTLRSRPISCLLLLLLVLTPSYLALAKGSRAKDSAGEGVRKPVGASTRRSQTPEPAQALSGTSERVLRTATVNFAELARRDALALAEPEKELRIVPEPEEEEEEARDKPVPPNAQIFAEQRAKTTLQNLLAPSPTLTASFQGAQATGWAPPDTQGAAGPNHLVVAVNGGVLVQSKSGTNIGFVRSLVSFFSNVTNSSNDVFDPRLQYDPYGNRWILAAVANRQSAASAIVLGVSQTSDPTGTWNLFLIDADSSDASWADFPILGFNKDWIVVTTNMFANPGGSAPFHANLYVVNKANAYAGTGSLTRISTPNSNGGNLVPASTLDPNIGTLYLLQNWNGNSGGSGFLRLYSITGGVGSEVLNNVSSGIFISTPNPWDSFPPSGGNFAPQLGTSDKLQVNDSGIQNVVYRNGSLWAAQTVFLPAGGPTRSSVQWWQINSSTNAVQQRGRIDDPSGSIFYGFPSIAVNKNNDVLIGYSRFSSTQYAGAGYAYRAGTDTLNTLRDDTVLKFGESSYSRPATDGRNRWGDYSGAVVDPSNDTDMWTIQTYAAFTNSWSSWWGRLGGGSPPPDVTPANNNFANAQLISGASGSIAGTNVGATKEPGEPSHADIPGGASVWYQWQAPANGTATFTTAGSEFDTLLAVYTGNSVGALTPIASNDDAAGGGVLTSSVTFNVTAGTTYRIAVDGYAAATGNINLNWSTSLPPPANDNFANAQSISGATGSVAGSNGGATKEAGEPNHGGNLGGSSVWYRWQAPSSGPVTITTGGSNFDTLLGVYTGSSVGALTLIATNDDDPLVNTLTSRVTFNAVSGTTYRIAVDGYANATGSITLNWNLVPTCSYSISPTSQSFNAAGGTGSVAVTVAAGCAWTAVSNNTSIASVTGGASGNGNGTVSYSVAANSNASARSATITIAGQTFTVNQDANTASTVQLGAASFSVNESAKKVLIGVTRTGSNASAASVDYATSDGTADRRKDYTQTLGTLTFAPGETSKTVTVFITDDAFLESNETFSFALSNVSGTTLGTPSSATVTIVSNDATTGPNPVDSASFNAGFYVGQHYVDFLNREADSSGLAFWTGQTTNCGNPDLLVCRVNVSGAFFVSIEFQNTGYLVYRFYKTAYGDATSPGVAGTVPVIRLGEFLPDTQRIGQGIIVGQGDWQTQIETNKQAFALEFVQRPRFLNAFPLSMTPAQFVDKLRQNTGAALSQTERDLLVSQLTANNTNTGRAAVLRSVAEDGDLLQSEKNRAFVLMQYYGYLRRNPDDAPEATLNFAGWKFWLDKLNQFGGDFVRAEMVKAFIQSDEYRKRFGN